MMKKKTYIITMLLMLCSTSISAQINDDLEIIFNDEEGQQEVINVPEALYMEELDSLMSLFLTQNYLNSDEACESSGENPYYSDEEIALRLRKMNTVIEMPFNNVVRQFIDRYTNRMRRSVSAWLGSINFYTPIFEQALESYNVPLELKYLPIIESALNPKAVSRVGATGLWQFMLATGKQYGLRVNSLVDDRRDPIRASYAAAKYLRDLFRIFGDWTLAIAAYNCGPENVNKAIRRSGGAMDYWKIYPYLPSETRGYVPAFIAANYVMTYYCDHNICPMLTTLPEHTDTVVVNHNVSLSSISKFCDIDINMLRELNPQYRRDLVNGLNEPSTIRMPIPAINRYVEQEDTIRLYDSEHNSKRLYAEIEERPRSTSRSSSSSSKSSSSSRYGRSKHQNTASVSSSSRYGKSSRGGSSKSNRKSGRRG
ncbi:MAG: lytic transglycosylase domain-containing protein [Prevotella sp.]|nr:lytic transglycosylase domain-containing protein [Prevotella sp.]MBP5506871.1 lytic transglycosylase domain-containing protein [Prevotella sp.]